MKIKLKDFLYNFIFSYLVFGLFTHEYGHLLALRIIGSDGYIKATVLNAVFPSSPITGLDAVFFYGFGGWFQAIMALASNVFDRDHEERYANLLVAIHGLIYGCIEGFLHRRWWDIGSLAGLLTAFLFIAYLIRRDNIILELNGGE